MCKALVIVLVAFSLGACGGKSGTPTAPGDSASSYALTIRAARVPQGAVAGATIVTEDFRSFTTNGNGTILLSASDTGKVLRITASGFTSPSVVVFQPQEQGMTHYLLPDDDGMSYAWIKDGFYGNSDSQWLWRPMPGQLAVELSDEGWADHRVSTALAWGSTTINNAQHQVSFNVMEQHKMGTVKMYSDPHDPIFRKTGYENAWAVTFLTTSGPVVVGARIVWSVFLDDTNSAMPEHIGKAMAHELGHVAGIQGHPCCGIMGSGLPLTDFSQQEKDALSYLFLRPPGTRPPDNLAAAFRLSTSTRVAQREIQACVLRR